MKTYKFKLYNSKKNRKDEECELIKEFAAIVKKDRERAARMMKGAET